MMNKVLRTLSPLVLAVYFFSFAMPSFGQTEANYLVTMPSSVTRGDSFDMTIAPLGTTLNLKDMTVYLPPGLTATQYPVTALPNGSYDYKILTGPFTGSFNVVITIATASGQPVTITRTVSVLPTFFDTYGPLIVWGSLILIVALSASVSYR